MIDVAVVHGDGSLLRRLQNWAEINARDLRISATAVDSLLQQDAARPDVVLIDVVPAGSVDLAADVRRLLTAGYWPLAVAREADPELGARSRCSGPMPRA